MKRESLLLNIVTPHKQLEENEAVSEIRVEAYNGQLGILPGHTPLMTCLSEGLLEYKPVQSQLYKKVALSWGYLEVSPKGVNILTETAEVSSEIDKERAKRSLERARTKLEGISKLSPKDILKNQRKMRRARVRLRLD